MKLDRRTLRMMIVEEIRRVAEGNQMSLFGGETDQPVEVATVRRRPVPGRKGQWRGVTGTLVAAPMGAEQPDRFHAETSFQKANLLAGSAALEMGVQSLEKAGERVLTPEGVRAVLADDMEAVHHLALSSRLLRDDLSYWFRNG